MRVVGDQAKTACRSLQLYAGIEARIEEATHAMVQRRRERTAPEPEERAENESEDRSMV